MEVEKSIRAGWNFNVDGMFLMSAFGVVASSIKVVSIQTNLGINPVPTIESESKTPIVLLCYIFHPLYSILIFFSTVPTIPSILLNTHIPNPSIPQDRFRLSRFLIFDNIVYTSAMPPKRSASEMTQDFEDDKEDSLKKVKA